MVQGSVCSEELGGSTNQGRINLSNPQPLCFVVVVVLLMHLRVLAENSLAGDGQSAALADAGFPLAGALEVLCGLGRSGCTRKC